MGRPAKAVGLKDGQMTNADQKARLDIEKMLKCGDSALEAPDELTPGQKKAYDWYKEKLEAAGVIGELHTFALVRLAVVVDRLNKLEQDARRKPDLIYDKDFISAQREYSRQFEKLCAEFCLTPQSMAKMSLAVMKTQEPKRQTLADILREGG